MISTSNAAIGGGTSNTVSGSGGTIGGGQNNTVSGPSATIPGGASNTASGATSLAAGNRAKAVNNGAFVWGDSTNADVSSTANDQFTVRANGGMVFDTPSITLLNSSATLTTASSVTLNASTAVVLPVNANNTRQGRSR